MMDLIDELKAVSRETGHATLPEGPARTVVLRRTYPAAIDDVWDAITDPERISRWFLPVSGDLRPGGIYQLEGNAGGRVLRCEPPALLAVTWIFGADPAETTGSEVEVRLAEEGGGTSLELRHVAVVDPELWERYGPGATGVGWDLSLLGLGIHLAGGETPDHEEWERSDEARGFMVASSEAWGAAQVAGGATAEEAAAAVTNTVNFYAPPPEGE